MNEKTSRQQGFSNWKVGDIIRLGKYKGEFVFEDDEIKTLEWRVLDVQNNKMLIISERIIKECPHNYSYEGLFGMKIITNWAQCSSREYLNGEFLDEFDPAERNRIAKTHVKNNKNPWFGTEGGEDTDDHVFLLSLEEVAYYFGNSSALLKSGKSNPDNQIFKHYMECEENVTNMFFGEEQLESMWKEE